MDSFAALADPTRRRIVEMLAQGALSAGEIGERFTVSAPAISQHLKTLREAGLVTVTVAGQRRIYELDPAGIDGFDQWVRRVRAFWPERLAALEAALQQPDPGEEA
ncbi:ArsR family transcriptional regulator [Bosea sp. Root381]|uniref:ArsR/SmtB family transcription factor n=1 Tax=Bosea sp. Root381 TaxID=1736524 RepID=UPI0006F84BDE|nr:metalloregulator ArsR/SmtB family transcription factor [Bosea sp. Root381]KRE02319.1 ArsR family transcriptional regulator [Bosea sp. Root381]